MVTKKQLQNLARGRAIRKQNLMRRGSPQRNIPSQKKFNRGKVWRRNPPVIFRSPLYLIGVMPQDVSPNRVDNEMPSQPELKEVDTDRSKFENWSSSGIMSQGDFFVNVPDFVPERYRRRI